jgi:acyl carrier protein
MDIDAEVKNVIAKTLKIPLDRLTDGAKLEDLGAESLDVIEMVYDLEEKFDISISFKADSDQGTLRVEAEKDGGEAGEFEFRTVGEIARAVKLLVDAKGG